MDNALDSLFSLYSIIYMVIACGDYVGMGVNVDLIAGLLQIGRDSEWN